MEKFNVGDWVKVILIPEGIKRMPPKTRDGRDGTLTVMKYLVVNGIKCKIVELDEASGEPWIEFVIFDDRGEVYHKLLLEPECLELV